METNENNIPEDISYLNEQLNSLSNEYYENKITFKIYVKKLKDIEKIVNKIMKASDKLSYYFADINKKMIQALKLKMTILKKQYLMNCIDINRYKSERNIIFTKYKNCFLNKSLNILFIQKKIN